MSEYKGEINFRYLLFSTISTYDMFIIIIGDKLMDKCMMENIINNTYNESKVVDYLIKYGINPIALLHIYVSRNEFTHNNHYKGERSLTAR